MALLRDENFEPIIPVFNGSSEEDFHIWELHIKAVLIGKDLINVIAGKVAEKIITQKALSITI